MVQHQEVLRAGEDESPGPGILIGQDLDVGEEVRGPLDFIQDDAVRKLPQEPAGIIVGKGALIGRLQ